MRTEWDAVASELAGDSIRARQIGFVSMIWFEIYIAYVRFDPTINYSWIGAKEKNKPFFKSLSLSLSLSAHEAFTPKFWKEEECIEFTKVGPSF